MLSLTSKYTRVPVHNANTHAGLAAAARLEEQCFGLRSPFGALTWCIYTKEEHHAVSHNTAPSCQWHNVSLKMETLKKNPYSVCPAVFFVVIKRSSDHICESPLSVVLRSHAALVI